MIPWQLGMQGNAAMYMFGCRLLTPAVCHCGTEQICRITCSSRHTDLHVYTLAKFFRNPCS